MFATLPILFAAPPAGCSSGFLGLVQWYAYLPSSSFGQMDGNGHVVPGTKCDITQFSILSSSGHSDFGLVLAAIVDDLLRIAGLLAIGFVIYGAVKFITSQGDPEGAARARGTVINALIGLAVAIIAAALVNFIGTQLGK